MYVAEQKKKNKHTKKEKKIDPFYHELLYSKRFTDFSSEDILEIEGIDAEGFPHKSKEELHREAQQLIKDVEEHSTFLERPGGCERRTIFIAMAKYISDLYEIDLDITAYYGHVEAVLYCFGTYFDEFPQELGKLLLLCDTMSVQPTPERKGYITLDLSCRSHDHYICGKKQDL